ncbi:anti-phage-associated DUF1156 domain-containing protein [Methylobacterium sp. C33D]
MTTTVVPYSLSDAPCFIEAQFPVGRVSAEVYKERKAIHGQILTSLGSYWKGRKPLLLVRATLLGLLLPATEEPLKDLQIFLTLLGMDDRSFVKRIKTIRPEQIDTDWPGYRDLVEAESKPRWRAGLSKDERAEKLGAWLVSLPYAKRLAFCYRPDECPVDLQADAWDEINLHLKTGASSIPELVEQLGIMRYGHRPRVADTFAGGGSIPFEAARIGCETAASDLSPIACMLTWGGLHIIGGAAEEQAIVRKTQKKVVQAVQGEIDKLGFERDREGRRSKAYLYCAEVRCPKTGYLVPVAPSWVISRNHRVVAQIFARPSSKDYDIRIITNATDEEILAAETGTLVGDRVVHPQNPGREGVAMSVIRGDYKGEAGGISNRIRRWSKSDVTAKEDDVFRERLYCIQWLKSDAIEAFEAIDGNAEEEGNESDSRSTFFAAPTAHDLNNEAMVLSLVQRELATWQAAGLVPDQEILTGDKTDEPIRTRGWTHWHQLFLPRHLLFGAITLKHIRNVEHPLARGALLISFCRTLNYMSKMTQWMVRNPTPKKPADVVNHVFYNQALNTFYNFGARASTGLLPALGKAYPSASLPGEGSVSSFPAKDITKTNDIYVTDPPYADAVAYHEITEYFIAWARKLGQDFFPGFVWDSRRQQAIKGVDEKFRADMVGAYRSMADHMSVNGSQVVMFTHQDAGVWADLAAIMWAAGLRVTAAWNVVTETESATKKGNYVKGTILLVLRKRVETTNIKRMDIEGEIEEAVDHQLSALHSLDEDWTSESLYTDGDLQLAAYAAALRVITNYATIDRKEVGADVYRKLAKGEKTVIRELIEYAASVANNKLVPDGFSPAMWRDLDAPSRFYVRMLDMESNGITRFADFQDFARTFSVADYADLMDSTKANSASLAGAGVLKGRMLGGKGFGSSLLRRVLFATHKTMQKDDPREGLAFLKTELGQDYWPNRAKLVSLAKYVSTKTARTRPIESSAADLLAQRLEVDKV